MVPNVTHHGNKTVTLPLCYTSNRITIYQTFVSAAYAVRYQVQQAHNRAVTKTTVTMQQPIQVSLLRAAMYGP